MKAKDKIIGISVIFPDVNQPFEDGKARRIKKYSERKKRNN